MYHFLQTSLVHVYSVSTVFTRLTVYPAVTGSSPCFSQKLFRAIFFSGLRDYFNFFRHSAPFFRFFCLQSIPPSSFFDILQQIKRPKSPKGLPFYVFWHYETVQNSHFSFCFENLKKFQFLFVFKGSPLQFI